MEEELDRDDPGIPEPQVKKHGLYVTKLPPNAIKKRRSL